MTQLSITQIQDGLRAESSGLPGCLSFKVKGAKRNDDMWVVELDPETANADNGKRGVVLDDALEGARAWWPGTPPGKASVLAVMSEEGLVFLADANRPPPSPGQWLRFYMQDYLEILRDIWRRTDWAERSIACQQVLGRVRELEPLGITPRLFPHLRAAQQQAFGLLGYETGFLWGPPGTGKTTTLGALIASCVVQKPDLRILLVGTTNQAVDQALVAADRSLEQLGEIGKPGRKRLCRFGSRFHAEYYKGRDHLIPIQDKSLLVELRRLELAKPDGDAAPEVLATWHRERERLKARIRAQMATLFGNRSVVAMTATRAAFALDDMSVQKQFDLLVFDEASQLGLANTLCLMPLAKRFLFAGDDKQLSPVVTSDDLRAQAALGQSPFKYRAKSADVENTVMLDEQSRMAEPICAAVSEAFYLGRLRVANDALADARWLKARRFRCASVGEDEALKCVDVTSEGQWSQKYRGLIRLESAEKIAEFVAQACQRRDVAPEDVVVLTPFRAQRVLIKRCLFHQGVKGVRVSTVHRSQGSEAKVVIFDPVKGDESFLTNPEGVRLVNVALSRAMAKLILFLSPGDRQNRHLAQFHSLSRVNAVNADGAVSLTDLLRGTRDRERIVGQQVRHGRHLGVVKAFEEPPGTLVLSSHTSGLDHEFQLSVIYSKL